MAGLVPYSWALRDKQIREEMNIFETSYCTYRGWRSYSDSSKEMKPSKDFVASAAFASTSMSGLQSPPVRRGASEGEIDTAAIAPPGDVSSLRARRDKDDGESRYPIFPILGIMETVTLTTSTIARLKRTVRKSPDHPSCNNKVALTPLRVIGEAVENQCSGYATGRSAPLRVSPNAEGAAPRCPCRSRLVGGQLAAQMKPARTPWSTSCIGRTSTSID